MKWEKQGQGAQGRGWVGAQGLSQAPDPILPISALPPHHYSHPRGGGERLLGGHPVQWVGEDGEPGAEAPVSCPLQGVLTRAEQQGVGPLLLPLRAQM